MTAAAEVRRRALFLDRDGVINVDHGYVHRPEQVQFCDGIFELVRVACERELAVVVVTNQAGIGRGYYTEQDFEKLSHWMQARFLDEGARLDRIYHCPSHPQHGLGAYRIESDWRKPAPGMLLQAAQDLTLDLQGSLLVGDNETDVQAGQRAGVGCTVLYSPQSADGAVPLTSATCWVKSLLEVVPHLPSAPSRAQP